MYTWWAFVRDSRGYPMRVTLQAPDPYTAYQMFLGMYGKQNMISEHAARA